jgi:Ni/Co efflux regulator RcnB
MLKYVLLAASALALTALPMTAEAQQHRPGGGGAPHGGGGGGAPHGGGGGVPHMGGGGAPHGGGGAPHGGGGMAHTGGGGAFRGAARMGGGGAHVSVHGAARTGGFHANARVGGGGRVTTTHVATRTVTRGGAGAATVRGGRAGGAAAVRGGRVAGGAAVGGRTAVRQSAAVHSQLRGAWSHNRAMVASHAVWRGNRNWWRGNAHFNGYTGPRSGYYFAPGFGYYAVPGIYWGHRWGIGTYLPLFFLTYALTDWVDYGVPPPPPGCAWVWVGPNLLLIDVADGYVIDEYYDVF